LLACLDNRPITALPQGRAQPGDIALNNNEGFRDSGTLTKWVHYLLWAQVIVAALSLISGNLEYQLLSDFRDGAFASQQEAVAAAEASDQRQSLAGYLNLIVAVISGILILRWIHRANYNARQLGASGMSFSPGWSIGYYFIPILNLWKPYQAMKEIWKASKQPTDWKSQSASSILPLWWFLWLVSGVLGQILLRLSLGAEELEGFLLANIVAQACDVLAIPLALVFLAIVDRIDRMQQAHLDRVEYPVSTREEFVS
jgi:hypothetical protein